MDFSFTTILLIVITILLLINIILTLLKSGGSHTGAIAEILEDMEDDIVRKNEDNIAAIRQDIQARISYDAEENRRNRIEVGNMIRQNQEKMESTLRGSLSDIQELNQRRMEEIRTDINRKLDTSLNERLDNSFKTVGEQLNHLYVSLGELSKLEIGVNSLNRTLTNVKTRGIYGEMQLEHILAEILPNTLYDKNVVTKLSEGANRDAVEFAVRIPDKESTGSFMYLPIDSKFPMSVYDRISDAADGSDSAELKTAIRELENRVKLDARNIHDKYIDPPNTTDFALMFLPTESLYAEVLRLPGLVEECQKRFHVVITGPSTMAALLNSLSIGFRYMAVNKDSQNILKLLSAIKTQYTTLSKLIDTTGSRIDSAKKANDELQHRAELINRKLSAVEEIDPFEADLLLNGPRSIRHPEVTEDFLD